MHAHSCCVAAATPHQTPHTLPTYTAARLAGAHACICRVANSGVSGARSPLARMRGTRVGCARAIRHSCWVAPAGAAGRLCGMCYVLTGQVRFASLARLGVQPDERSSECTERRLFATAARAWPEHPPPPTRRRAWYAAEPCTCWSKCGGGGRRLHGCPPVECAQAAHTPPRT